MCLALMLNNDKNKKINNTMFSGLGGNVTWMVRGSGSTSPWCHMAPKPFTEEAAPQLLVQDWPGLPVGSRASRAGGPGQPALHACSWASCK